jgi:putative FmdB family regulatory protein
MPTYQYHCDTCGVVFDRLQRFTDDPLTECPECNGHVHRVIHPVGIIFKGKGFYCTDNKKSYSPTLPGNREDTGKSDSEKTEKTENKSEVKSEKFDSSPTDE